MPARGHAHDFLDPATGRREARVWAVVGLTLAAMALEIWAGLAFGSVALLADGLHMATHAGALAVAGLAYRVARSRAGDPRFAFGTGKIGDLAGFASALMLGLVAFAVAGESLWRLWAGAAIELGPALAVAVIGLAVNVISALLLAGADAGGRTHKHGHAHAGAHAHTPRARDHNMQGAILHVAADALTSLLAILGLLAAMAFGWLWADAAIGLLGAAVIAVWSVGLLRRTGAVLLDATPSDGTAERVRARLEAGGDRVTDLHVWTVGPGHLAVIATVETDRPRLPAQYRQRLDGITGLSHVTIEVEPRHPARGLPLTG